MPCIKVEQRFFPLGPDPMKTLKLAVVRAVVVVQLAELSLPTLQIRSWNPNMGKVSKCLSVRPLLMVEQTKIKKKMPG